MKRFPLFKTLMFVSCFNVIVAQQSDVIEFTSTVNTMVNDSNPGLFYAFEVNKMETTETVVETPAERVANPEYSKLAAKVKQLEAEYSKAKSKNDVVVAKNSEMAELENVVGQYLNSTKPFVEKKVLLKKAQIISDKHKYNYQLYADEKINTKFKTKFFILSKNKIELKIHVKRQYAKIKSSLKKAPVEDISPIKKRLDLMKYELRKTDKYSVAEAQTQTKKSIDYKLGNKLSKPHKIIFGQYKTASEYYLTRASNGFKMLSVADYNNDKESNKLASKTKFTLINATKSNKSYLITSDLINEYSGYSKNTASILEPKN